MNFVCHRFAFLAWLLTTPALFGQPAPIISPGKDAAIPPLPPPHQPPISFRQVLLMDTAEREKFLATRSSSQREVLQAKLREYQSLPLLEREARLCTLGLRQYLRPLMEAPLSNRVERVAAVPQPDRKLVEERLQFWDKLAPAVQREFLTNEWVLRYIFRPEATLPAQATNATGYVRKRIEEAIAGWNQLPEPKRQEILDNFKNLFEFSEKQKAKILGEFSDVERQRMQRALRTFESLPKAQRERCVNGFQKFAGLSIEEREQFLRNVDLWQQMSAQDRLAWRSMVSRISLPKPPAPPGMDNPPLPPTTPPPKPAAVASSTNNQ